MKLRVDSPIIQTGIRLVDLLILNVMWAVGCIPVVTAGASTIAAFTVTLKMAEKRESSGVLAAFWTAYGKNLKHGVPLTLIFAVVVYGIWLDWQLFRNLEGNTAGFLIVALLAGFFLLIHYIYVFPLEARYANTIWRSLANSRRIFMRFFVRTLGLIGILVIQVLIFTPDQLSALVHRHLLSADPDDLHHQPGHHAHLPPDRKGRRRQRRLLHRPGGLLDPLKCERRRDFPLGK